jgi:2-aminoadipate transaminase
VTTLPTPQTEIEPRLARWIERQGRSVLRQMVGVVSQPGVISLAGGLPAPELFPVEPYGRALQEVLHGDARALQYGPPIHRLKEQIVELMARRGVDCAVERVVITSGAQQGIDIAARLLLEHGGAVAMERLSYTGVQQAVAPLVPKRITVPSDLDAGLDVEALEERLRAGERFAFLYVVPDAHNPLGVSLAPERRERLVELAREFGFWLLEDDPYGLLGYDGDFEAPLAALDDRRVIYLGSFSKILAPGLRLGWMVVPEEAVAKVGIVKDALDLESSGLTQRAVTTLLDDFDLDAHLDLLRDTYRTRRDAMIEAVADQLPTGCRFSRPAGGMFVWVDLPGSVDAEELLMHSMEREKVAFIPGHAFAAEPGVGRQSLRLSFSTLQPERIREAVAAIARCLP